MTLMELLKKHGAQHIDLLVGIITANSDYSIIYLDKFKEESEEYSFLQSLVKEEILNEDPKENYSLFFLKPNGAERLRKYIKKKN